MIILSVQDKFTFPSPTKKNPQTLLYYFFEQPRRSATQNTTCVS